MAVTSALATERQVDRFVMHASCVRLRTIVRHLYSLACVAGCVFQVYQVCDLYFHYGTTSQFLQDANDRLPPPDFAFCARYPELMKTAVFRSQEEAVANVRTTEEEFQNLITLFSQHTLKQIFDLTPSPDG